MKQLFTLGETERHMDKANLISLRKATAVSHTYHHGSLSAELPRKGDVGSGRQEENVYVRTKAKFSCHLKVTHLDLSVSMLFRNMEERTHRENIFKPGK